ncbi:ABC transporter permease [Amycolatopsis palatopharyngis]|uniref:ABC transporter permease n=1 Tax=Amycolatopsis palatopharyngis TaxID=187982 RepID=UPI000E235926|nr:ABC transporter permease [Amycolatopsis palatopharyngis]
MTSTEVVAEPADPVTSGKARRSARDLLGIPGLLGVTILGLLILAALVGPLFLSNEGLSPVAEPWAEARPGLWLGGDDVGKDLFAQLVIGSRASLFVGIAVASVVTATAALIGGFAAVGPRWLSAVLMRFADVTLALPMLPLLILAAAFLGPGVGVRVLLLAALTWAGPARVIRAGVLAAWSAPHVEVAKAMGAPVSHLLVRHASYAVAPLLIPIFVRAAMGAVIADASLSFLGLGDPTSPSWGTILYWASTNGAFLTDAWARWALPPGLIITLTVVALGLIGVAVEERINPTLRKVR